MSDYSDVKAKALAALSFSGDWHEPDTAIVIDPSVGPWNKADADYVIAAHPKVMLSLIARIEALETIYRIRDGKVCELGDAVNGAPSATTFDDDIATARQLRAALEFYASVFNYVGDKGDRRPPVVRDNGRQARAALSVPESQR